MKYLIALQELSSTQAQSKHLRIYKDRFVGTSEAMNVNVKVVVHRYYVCKER